MTAIVGILCRDGVVIGADSSTTFVAGSDFRTIEQPTDKIYICEGSLIVAGTGSVGLGQRFCRTIDLAYHEMVVAKARHHIEAGTEICRRARADFASTGVEKGKYGALVAFSHSNKPYLCEFATDDFQPEFKTEKMWFCSMGSGQPITDPFLAFMRDVFWSGGVPTVQDATFAATWTLEHAVEINPGGINRPVRIAVLDKKDGKFRARLLDDDALAEHRQNIEQAKKLLRDFSASQRADAPGTPDLPKPPT